MKRGTPDPLPDDDMLVPAEREYLRSHFGTFFGSPQHLSGGIWLRKWAGGPNRGKPKISPVLAGLIARGLAEVRELETPTAKAFLTERGMEAMRRAMLADRRYFSPESFGHLWEELGLPVRDIG
jgi:hypothetical protein